MRYETLLAALLILGQASCPSDAVERMREPQFSGADVSTISRNEVLKSIVAQDPWLVRRILDLMARRASPREADPYATPPDGIDAASNPDLANSTRTAAGSIEWIELLKRARAERDTKSGAGPSGKSAASSVEFIEMLRNAQKTKKETK